MVTGNSEPLAAGGMVGPEATAESSPVTAGRAFGADSVVRAAAVTTCLFEPGTVLIGVPALPLEPIGKRFDVLEPDAGAAGTLPAAGNAAGGAMPPAGAMPPVGWLLNCGVLPVGAARADGSPAGLVVEAVDACGCRFQAELFAGAAATELVAAGWVRAVAGLIRWKFELLPEPAQPVNVPTARRKPAHPPIVRILMRFPLHSRRNAEAAARNRFRPFRRGRRSPLVLEHGGDLTDRPDRVKGKRPGCRGGRGLRPKTSSIIEAVSRPVKVFCWLGW